MKSEGFASGIFTNVCGLRSVSVRVRHIFGHIDRGKEVETIPHGNAVFVFRVMRFNIEFGFLRAILCSGKARENDHTVKSKTCD